MTQAQVALDIINWGINVAFVITLLFPIGVRPFWNWTESDWGWNIVAFDTVVALALLPTWLHHTLGITSGTFVFLWIEATSIWAVPVVVLWRAWIIFQAQRHADIEKEESNDLSGHQRVSEDS
jgi:hypothetical protein